MISDVATAVDHEISQGSYIAWSSKLAKWQQAHVVQSNLPYPGRVGPKGVRKTEISIT